MTNNYRNHTYPVRFFIAVMCSLFLPVSFAYAVVYENNNSSSITNSISVSAQTGGNTSDGGSVYQGKGSVDVSVETVVNGQVVQQVEEHKESANGEPISIEKDIKYEDKDDGTVVHTSVQANVSSGTVSLSNIEEGVVLDPRPIDNVRVRNAGSKQLALADITLEKTLAVKIVDFFAYVFSFFKI